jgi:hypothetical protein
MIVPQNAEVFDTLTSTYWYDDAGFVCSISKKRDPPLSLEETKKVLEEFKSNLRTEKICLLIDVTHTSETTREIRDYAAVEFPKFVKAIAMVSESALGKMLANLFFSVKTQPYPTKMFNDEEKARVWLKQHCK